MPDQWIDESVPARSPSPEFVSRLRDELIDEWRDDGVTVWTSAGPSPRRLLPWAVALASAAAVVAVVVVLPDSGRQLNTVPATAVTSDVSSTPTTTTLSTGSALLEVLSTHRWVKQPYLGMDVLPSAPWIEFDPTGRVLTLFDGCSTSALAMTLVDEMLSVTGAAPDPVCGGWTLADPIGRSSLEISQADGVLYLVLAPTDEAQIATIYTALDTTAPATRDDLVGRWGVATGGTIHLAADGSVGIGFCSGVGNWTFEDGQLRVTGVDGEQSIACAGGQESSWLTRIENEPLDARSAGYMLLTQDDTTFVLGRASLDRSFDVLDLEAGTIYGFGLPSVAPADFVTGVVSGERGQPTFDSGWYLMENAPAAKGASCLLGQPARVVQWGDLVLGFIRVGDRDRLWSWSLGEDASALEQQFAVPGGLPGSTPTQLKSRPPNRVGIGTTLAEIRSWHAAVYEPAFAFADISLTGADDLPVVSDDDALRGVLQIGPSAIDMVLAKGAITWMSMTDGTSC